MHKHFLALRGLAIVLVVLSHSTSMGISYAERAGYAPSPGFEQLFLMPLWQMGIFAVPTFLFLSGCFLVYAARSASGIVPVKVIWQGIRLILFPYVIWSVVFYMLMYWFHGEANSLAGYFKNLLVGYPYNFVPLIVFYYLLSPALIWLSKRHPLTVLVLIGLYQIFLINIYIPGIMGVRLPAWTWYLTPPVLRGTLALWSIFFPLGVVYSLHMKSILPVLQKYRRVFLSIAGAFLIIVILNTVQLTNFPLASYISPLAFVLVLPTMKRENIPAVRWFEKVGKHAFGLYLTNMIVLDLLLIFIHSAAPGVLQYLVLLAPALICFTLLFPLWVMSAAERFPYPTVYRYVFG